LRFRLQLKSTLVDRIIRDRSLIPPDHYIIRDSNQQPAWYKITYTNYKNHTRLDNTGGWVGLEEEMCVFSK
jgi:hypothetical protein